MIMRRSERFAWLAFTVTFLCLIAVGSLYSMEILSHRHDLGRDKVIIHKLSSHAAAGMSAQLELERVKALSTNRE